MSMLSLPIMKAAALVVGSALAAGAVGGAIVLTRPSETKEAPENQAVESAVTVQTLTGRGESGPGHGRTVNGPLDLAEFETPTSLAADLAGNIYVSDNEANLIRRIDALGNVATFAGTGVAGFKDGPALEAQFNAPNGLAVGPDGAVYVADSLNHRIRRITTDGRVETVAGFGSAGLGRGAFEDGPIEVARFNLPKGVAIATDGRIFVADTDNLRIRVIDGGSVSTYAGSGEHGRTDGPRLEASFANLLGVVLARDGTVYVADQPSGAIRRIALSGEVTTVARGLGFPAGVAIAASGNLIVADTSNQRIVVLDSAGNVILAVGAGQQGFLDGPASEARFFNPTSVIQTGSAVLVADSDNHRVRKLEGMP